MALESINPATGETFALYESWNRHELRAVVAAVAAASRDWAETGFDDRSRVLTDAARLLRARMDDLARLMAAEMGKPVTQGRAEVDKCAWACDHFAEHAAAFLSDERVESDGLLSAVCFEPLGVILGVMPWNFPLWQVFRFAAPALMAGNAILLKHASSVTGCSLAIERLLRDAGLPRDVFRALLIGASQVEEVVEDPRVAAVSVTGSEAAGRSIGAAAGRELKPSVLELGGSDPFIILADADIASAARVGALARTQNAGQSCIAAKRFIVVEPVHEAFVAAFVARMAEVVVGDPLDPATELGPLARRALRDALHAQVSASVALGARVALGGQRPEGPGAFYPVTVLTNVRPGMPAHDEEVFGPVAAISCVADTEAALRLANASRFGLGAALWTRDLGRAQALARRIEAGSVFVNGMVKSDPRLPFGGIKCSGYGRELSAHGIREFVNVKTLWVAREDAGDGGVPAAGS
jgi:succinate-semialdehyde dehydrogenase/glutarate-semialdehyde dehydrogenase